MTADEHLEMIKNKGIDINVEDGFLVFHGYSNIFLGSHIFLVDSLINAGDSAGSITIDDFVFFGHGVKILARMHDYNEFYGNRQSAVLEKPIHIKEGAWIASGSIVLGGVTIGKHSVVAAGSVVTKNVPDYTIVAGNPAKVLRKIRNNNENRFFKKLKALLRENRLICI